MPHLVPSPQGLSICPTCYITLMASFCASKGLKPPTGPTLLSFFLLCLWVGMAQGLSRVQLQARRERVRRSQVLSFSQTELTNFYNYQYYCKIAIGTPPQRVEVILDTGSHHLWVPAKNCSNCPITVRRFDPTRSSSGVLLDRREEIKYGKGEIKGFYIEERVAFEQSAEAFSFILADYQKDTEHSQADGIMGLSNYKKVPNFFEILQRKGSLVSSSFAFQLGLKELRQKSYFYYNISEEDFPDAAFINASRKDYWTIPVRGLRVDGRNFTVKDALVDSGTSLILMPAVLYNELDEHLFSRFCDPYKVGDIRNCKCPSSADYPNLTIFSGQLAFNITPSAYVLGSFNNRVCMLGIDILPPAINETLILGDLFFHQRLVLFDKQNNRIGFVSNHKMVNLYPAQWALTILNVVAILSLAVVVMVLGLRKKQSGGGGMLREPLRGAAMEMATA